jgi:hypothetical protein
MVSELPAFAPSAVALFKMNPPADAFHARFAAFAFGNTRFPVPVLVIVPAEVIGAEMIRPWEEAPETLIVGATLKLSAVPLIVGVKAVLSFTTVIGIAEPRFNRVPTATVGVAVPPELLNVRLFNVFVPVSVSVLPLFNVTLLVAAI